MPLRVSLSFWERVGVRVQRGGQFSWDDPHPTLSQRERVYCSGNAVEDHAVSANNSRPISMRRISLVPAPISYSLASRSSRPVG